MLTQTDADKIKSEIGKLVPVCYVSISTLGGVERTSIYMTICFDPKETWINNILENSKYMKISIDHELNVRHFSGKMPERMRGFKAFDFQNVIDKIARFVKNEKERT
jgi:hypothetical protein